MDFFGPLGKAAKAIKKGRDLPVLCQSAVPAAPAGRESLSARGTRSGQAGFFSIVSFILQSE